MDDMISRRAAIDAICKDGIQRERQGQYSITMVDRKYLDTEILEALPSAQPGWIPVTERLPENEQEVFVTVEVRPIGCKPRRRVIKAFYTDGKHTDADSAYTWYELEELDCDDNGNIIIPEGWWEAVDYSDEFNMIDDFVVAWRELPEPWEGRQDD